MTETDDIVTTEDAATGAHTGAGASATADKAPEEKVIEEALALIDRGLTDLMHRELVSTDEMSDLLLDVRMLLTTTDLVHPAAERVEEPVGA